MDCLGAYILPQKQKKSWEVISNQASQIVRKIIQERHWLEEKEIPITEIIDVKGFSIEEIYKKLRGEFIKVPWRGLTEII